jgi:hypothetical protein
MGAEGDVNARCGNESFFSDLCKQEKASITKSDGVAYTESTRVFFAHLNSRKGIMYS